MHSRNLPDLKAIEILLLGLDLPKVVYTIKSMVSKEKATVNKANDLIEFVMRSNLKSVAV
jgi:ribosomal protein RSM22 (predicted rRNA methylase)